MPEMFVEALAHHKAGRLAEAERLYRLILAADSRHSDSLHMLGMIAHQRGRNEDAIDLIDQAIAIVGTAPSYHYNFGVVLAELGRFDDAVAAYDAALRFKSDFAEAHSNQGIALYKLGRLDDAVAAYGEALGLKPDFARAHFNLGNALCGLKRLEEALDSYRAALRFEPDYPKAHGNLGNALKDLKRLDDAVIAYRAALCLKPDFDEAAYNLGIALYDLGRHDDSLAAYGAARRLRPDSLSYAADSCLMLPIIPESLEDIAAWRERYAEGIAALVAGDFAEEPDALNQHSFYLAYHDRDNRSSMEALGRMFRQQVPQLTMTAPHVAGWRPPADRRIKVGFVSEHLVTHTIGNLNQGFIRHLDRQRFEVVLLHTQGAKRDAFSRRLDAAADKSVTLPADLAGQQQAIAAEELDLLFFPDIGMAQTTYFLAHARLAPVQAMTWGHPETSGLDTMDYFLAPESFVTEDSEAHFSEKLVRLTRANCYFEPPEMPDRLPDRAELGLPETGTLYGCPQSLFKFHPEFDSVLAEIAKDDPTGRIVLLEGRYPNWEERLRTRWARTFPILAERSLFLPKQSRRNFMALQGRMDVLLDPIHFGGGNTFYEAMVYGTPMVTWPGWHLRSRIAGGLYRQMGIEDAPIVSRLEDYAPLALALGRDPGRCRRLREASIEAAKRELLLDMRAVREFEDFLEAAIIGSDAALLSRRR